MQHQHPVDLTILVQQTRSQRDKTVAALIQAGFRGAKQAIRNAVAKHRAPATQ